MIGDPLMPHLLDILSEAPFADLIIAGGFGIRVKQERLNQITAKTLISPFPHARATGDLDIFLNMDIFEDEELGSEIHRVLTKLGYKVRNFNWQFHKPLGDAFPNRTVKIDLLSRQPVTGEDVPVRPIRGKAMPSPPPLKVGKGLVHGFQTIEAFALDCDLTRLPVRGRTTAEEEIEREVMTPHPYTWLNMKVRAAHDWLKMEQGDKEKKPFAEKHPFDVYVLTAMLMEDEIERCSELATEFANHKVASEIRAEAHELFAMETSPGSIEARRQTEGEFDFETFNEALHEALGY